MRIPPFRLERYFARYEFDVEYVLCASDCESLAVRDLLALEPDAHDRFMGHWLGYTESQGSSALRCEISRIYTTIAPENVLVHAGAEEAIYLFMHAALRPGDHVIVHWPCYQSLFEVARSIGCQVTRWEAREEKGWALDLDELRAHLRPNTQAVVVNTPHNPTGYLMSREDYLELHEIVEAHGALLFSDEVYRESEYRSEDRLPAGCDVCAHGAPNAHAVSLGVTSKTYGLAGLRVGWIATHNAEVYERMAALKDYTTICNSAPSEFLAELALRHREQLAARNVGLITENLALLDEFFARHGDRFTWQRPAAGPIAFPRLLGEDVDSFCDALVRQASILLLPGTMYGHPGNHFRIGFGRKNVPQALARLEAFLG